MRKLIVFSHSRMIRNLLESGALEGIDDGETFYLASERWVPDRRALEAKPGYLGAVPPSSKRREKLYRRLRTLMMIAYRRRSRTIALKLGDKLSRTKEARRLRFEALPLVRSWAIRRRLADIGLNDELQKIMEEVRLDLVIVPSAGIEELAIDAVRGARALGVPSLVLIPNWDNLSSKGAFPVKPDYLCVWGPQSVEQARRIHSIPRKRVRALGVPTFDSYFRHEPGSTDSPFPFRYALFAGCLAPFDERSALEALDRAIEEHGLDLKVVYRPHPVRSPRKVPDHVGEGELRHVVLDPQVRDLYELSFEDKYVRTTGGAKPSMPALDYYPALLENAAFVVCPLSTMIVESAIFERRVVVVAYDDGVHDRPPSVIISYEHFEGIDRVEGFEIARTPQQMTDAFVRLTEDPTPPARSLRDQIGWWLHHDERPYAERLSSFVDEIARREGLPPSGRGRPTSTSRPPPAVAHGERA